MQLEIYWIVVFMVIIRMHLLKVEVSVWCSLSRILWGLLQANFGLK